MTGDIYYIPCWKEQEILAAAPYALGRCESAILASVPGHTLLDIMRERVAVVGPIPRRVFSTPSGFSSSLSKMDTVLTTREVDIANVLLFGGITPNQDDLSALFAIQADEGSSQPFCSPRVQFVSDYVRQRLGLGTIQTLWNFFFLPFGSPGRGHIGDEFERLVWCLVRNGLELPMELISPTEADSRQLTLRVISGNAVEVPGGRGFQKRAYEAIRGMGMVKVTDGVVSSDSPPVYMGNDFRLVDIALARNFGARVAITKKEAMLEFDEIESLRGGLGLEDSETLHIVHITPEGHEQHLRPLQTPLTRQYRAVLPSPHTPLGAQVWTRFLRRPFSTMRPVLRLFRK